MTIAINCPFCASRRSMLLIFTVAKFQCHACEIAGDLSDFPENLIAGGNFELFLKEKNRIIIELAELNCRNSAVRRDNIVAITKKVEEIYSRLSNENTNDI